MEIAKLIAKYEGKASVESGPKSTFLWRVQYSPSFETSRTLFSFFEARL